MSTDLCMVREGQVPVHVSHLRVIRPIVLRDSVEGLSIPLERVFELEHALERVSNVVLGPRRGGIVLSQQLDLQAGNRDLGCRV